MKKITVSLITLSLATCLCFLTSCDGGVTNNTVGYDDVDDSDWKKKNVQNHDYDNCVDFCADFSTGSSNDVAY